MAGHSKFKKIKHKKGAQDAKRSNIFTKLIREITVAVKMGGGPDPDFNARLRVAIAAAREENMPKDRIEAAIGKASSDDQENNYEEIRYEGYGPAGTALIVECLTDNRNRSASEIRAIFGKNGGNLGEIGSVSYLFKKVGYFIYGKEIAKSEDDFILSVVDAGAEDYLIQDDYYEILCDPEQFHKLKEALERLYGEAQEAKLEWRAENMVQLEGENFDKAMKLLDSLEDNDDVQKVFYNFLIPEENED